MGKLVLVVLWALSLCRGLQSESARNVPRSLEETTSDSSSGFCSTWGNGAFRTFDDKFYHFTSTCNYILSRQCTGGTEDFNIQIHRGSNGNMEHIYIQMEGVKIVVVNGTISVQDVIIRLPHHDKVIGIYKRGIYTQLSNRKHTISVNWNSEDALWITLDDKYQGQVCGLCGKFEKDSSSTYDSTFFDANKLDVLGHTCYSNPQSGSTCAEKSQCEAISELFLSCFGNTVIGQYWKMCNADVCSCKVPGCKCATFAEIARQCNKDNMRENWRTHTKCTQPTCPGDQIFKECGPACIPTCTDPNPQQQCDQCVNTCDCPEGNVLDNVRGTNRCISKRECPCEYSGDIYQSGEIRNTSCQSCICKSGKWSCSYHSCPGRCTIEEGTYLTTFDNTYYSMVGDCSYYAVFTEDWTIKVELRQCQAAFKQTCLQRVTLTKNLTTCMFSNDGSVYFDGRKVAFPLRTGEIIVFQQSLIYIQVATTFGLKMQVQISPVMQLYISLPVAAKGSTKGLCGTFNDDAEDDFLSAQGIVEGTPITFANSWKADDSCSEAKIPSPCVSSENENFAKQHCSQLKDPTGAFSVCHSAVDYLKYYQMCVAATCGCENIEDCLCAGLGAYVHECAANGVIVRNWRREICNKPCANTQVFENDMRACNRTCRSLSEYDYTCGVQDVPVYGCGCPERKYMDNTGACIDKSDCSCYIGELIIKRGQSVTLNGRTCTCENGKPYCPTVPTTTSPGCLNGKVFYDCSNTILNQKSNEKKCRSRSIPSENTQCVPGCVCPDDLVEDDSGRCIAAEQCPCLFGGESHPTGKTIQRDCNKCTCKAGVWHCTTHPCPKTCQVHGDGQYVTFDGKRYMFDGNCEYIFAEDHCNQGIGTFQILTEGVPCCENGVTCSRNIKIFLAGKQFILMDGRVVRAEKSGQTQCTDDSYSLHTVGLYLILTFSNGITVIWDKRTRLSITLDPRWKKKVCGLCGNFNDDVSDDLTTKGNSLVTSTVKFGSSWKSSLSCSDTLNQTFPCDRNPYCLAWAQRKCSIMKDAVFQKCHKKVDPTPYYDACVQEACACDMEGKYLGFCTAVAVYAEVCNKAGVCIDWRTPDLCPVYCDYYNKPDECSWHYHPCGTLTTKTCSDHYIGKKFSAVLEGCYAKCPESAPYLDENKMKCVNLSECTCYHNGKILQPGKGTRNDCEECECKNGKVTCIALITSTTTTSISTSPSIVTTSATTTTELPCYGIWSSWSDDYILSPISHGNSASLDPIRNKLCPSASYNIGNIQHQCIDTSEPISNSENNVTCDDDVGLISTNNEDDSLDANKCSYYRTRICCEPATVSPTTSPPRTSTPETTSPEVIPITTTSTTSFEYETTTPGVIPITTTSTTSFEYETTTPEVIPITTTSTTSYTTETTTPGVIPITTTSTTSFEYETTTPEVIPITTTSTTSYTTETTTPGVIPITTTSTTSFEYETTTPEVIPITTTSTTSYTTETTTPEVIPITTTSTTNFEYDTTTTEVIPISTTSTTTEEICNGKWSPWFNEHTPSPLSPGDSELLDPIRGKLCPSSSDAINKLQCQFVDYPDWPVSESTDNVTCDKDTGLVCIFTKSALQESLLCYDYQIRVCCEPRIISERTTTSLPITTSTTTMPETTTPEVIPITTTSTTNYTTETTTPEVIPITTSSTTNFEYDTTTTEVIPISTTSTTTEEICNGKWSPWFNEHTPSPLSPGDSELLDPIRGKLCPSSSDAINKLQCQFVDYPDWPVSESTDNVTCDKDTGLVCIFTKSALQESLLCYDYQIRVCCEPRIISERTTTSLPITTSTTTMPETTTPEVIPITTTSTTSYTTETTTPEVIPITTTSTTNFEYDTTTTEVIPISTTSTTTEMTTPEVIPITTTSTEYETTTPEVIPITTTSTTSYTTESTIEPFTTRETTSPEVIPITTSYTTETTSPGVIPITTTSTTSFEYESTTEVVTEPTTEPFTTPEVFCNGEWSGWFNENTPSMVNKGDSELLEPMRNSLCPFSPYKISDIDCEAVKFPQRPISETKDNVTCDINKGLICNHNEQNPENHLTCLDYRIRVCCEQAITTSITPTTTIPTVMHTTSEPMIIPFTEPPLESCLCNVKPPRKCMETWKENCTMITCIKNDLFKMDPIVCPALIKPTCNNEIEPVKIRTENGCCEKWECDCECEIWGDPHYRTFDGQWYDFFENCTYTLVEERVPKYNFSVLVDNYFCLSLVKKSCPKGLVISYNGNVVYISTGGVYVLTVNGNDVSLPYSSKGFKIIKPGGSTYISIPDIRTSITAFRNAFTIRVPEKYFFNNTKGQCGSCSHTPAQCTRKNGKVEPSDCCHKTAYDWRVDDPTKPYCQSAPNNVPCAPVPPPPTCKTEKTICDIIQEKPFEQCRRKINLDKYIKICTFDHCALNGTIDCSSLEAAASACASKGVCVDWRSFTNGLCRYPCDQGLVYKPCQNKGDDQCESHVVIAGDTFIPMLEGCFCPDGLILSEDKSKCVASCAGCRDNLGHPRKEGETWEDAEDPCVSYLCTPYGVVTSNRSCSQDESCPESHRIYIDRCCFICKIPIGNCKISTFNETVRKGNCEATFEMRQCSGLCSSATRYDFQRNHMDHDCHCCHEHETEKMSVKLHCKNGSTKKAKYIAIKTCMCKNCEKGKSN
uniref:mucin-2-like isoform X3 n=1 Tax=Pristiophorus japonicus TaxID=55135 RepID=UPI00398F21EB